MQIIPAIYDTRAFFQYKSAVPALLKLDSLPSTSFSVSISTVNSALITPSTITFTHDDETLIQYFTIKTVTLGKDIITYTITGIDAANVDPLGTTMINVIQCMLYLCTIENSNEKH